MNIVLHVQYPLFLSDFNETCIFSRQIFEKYSNMKFYENPSSESRIVSSGRTDGQTAGEHFLGRAPKLRINYLACAKPELSSAMFPTISDVLVPLLSFLSHGSTAVVGLGLRYEVPPSHSDTPHSVGRLWTRDRPIATHYTQRRNISMTQAGFEPAIPASEEPQTHALHRTATGIGLLSFRLL